MRGTRACGAAPAEIRAWSLNDHTRRPEEAVDLRNWMTSHPDRIDKRYGAFCDTPLHLAARFGREDLAGLLIDAGANLEALNEHDELTTPCRGGLRPSGGRQTAAGPGAGVNARGPAGKTPLHAAAFGVGVTSDVDARTDVAKLLLAAGADVNARQPGNGFMPLRYASSAGYPDHGDGGSAARTRRRPERRRIARASSESALPVPALVRKGWPKQPRWASRSRLD